MRKYHSHRRRRSEPIVGGLSEAERTRLNGELLIALANAVAANEKTQKRFRNAVLIRLSRIEVIVTKIHGAQIAKSLESVRRRERSEKMAEWANAAEESISRASEKLGEGMVRYIYGQGEPVVRRDGRRKWSGWEI
jgi:hypothetical protein